MPSKKKSIFDQDILNLLEYVEEHPDDKEEMLKRRRNLLRKYNEYYEDNSIKNKQQFIIVFMEEKINSGDEVNEKSNTYAKMAYLIKFFRENKNDEERYFKVSSLYKTPEKLWNAYHKFVIPLINDKKIIEIHNIYKFYKNIEDKKEILTERDKNQELIKYFEEVKEYIKYYDYAKFIINKYIEDESNYMFDNFLESVGINRTIFNYCTKVVEELDVDLYKKYEIVHKENIIRKYIEYKENLENIIIGIKTGKLIDGKNFDLVSFWKNIPFTDSKVAVEEFKDFKTIEEDLELRAPGYLQKIRNFVKITIPAGLPTLNQFIFENKISVNIRKVDLEKLNSYRSIVNGKEITKDDNNKIINYMINNNIPLIESAYVAVRNKYLNNELNLEEKTIKRIMKKTLIP